jgi:hypothetical protein
MSMKRHYMAAAAAITLVMSVVSTAWASVDNSQPTTAALCTGSCGVGSAIGAVRQINQVNNADATGTTFTDFWTFTLSQAGNVSGILFSNNTLNLFQLNDLKVILESGDGLITYNPATGYTVPNPPPPNTVLQAALSFADLAAGNYRFVISGLVPGTHEAGQYQLQGQISAVPLPAAVWLLLSAVLGLASVSRLRRGMQNAA